MIDKTKIDRFTFFIKYNLFKMFDGGNYIVGVMECEFRKEIGSINSINSYTS